MPTCFRCASALVIVVVVDVIVIVVCVIVVVPHNIVGFLYSCHTSP
jgi:hypothetical protein